jgi:hypothetical protein
MYTYKDQKHLKFSVDLASFLPCILGYSHSGRQ